MLYSLENYRMMNFGSLWWKLVYSIIGLLFVFCSAFCARRWMISPRTFEVFQSILLLDILTIFYVMSARCLLGYVCSFSPLNPVPLQCSPLSIISLLHLSSSPPSRWLARLAARSVRLDLGRDVVDFGEALCTSRTDWV